VFDTATHELLGEPRDSQGGDAHGVRVTPDGSELWMVNRTTSNAIIIDTTTDEVIEEIDGFGESPDILDFSPDGELAFITLRGPNPRSGAVHAVNGDTPGFAVVDVATRELVQIVQPNEGDEHSDFHGIGVRILTAPEVPESVTRVAAGDRIATAVTVSRASFADEAAGAAVLARADDYPDALAGTPLAAATGGPVLLTPTDELPEAVAAELTRILADGDTVYVLGGPSAVGPGVVTAVEELGFTVERIAGPTRFETALLVASELDDPDAQLITTGLDFPDALSAGAAAAHIGGAVLLTTPDVPHPATQAYLEEHPSEQRWAVGGPAARAHPDATALEGASRFETAVAVADAFFADATTVGLARGGDFPDALAGGAHIAALGGPLLLTPSDSLHPVVSAYVCDASEQLTEGFAYGGAAALSDGVLSTLGDRLEGEGCGPVVEPATVRASATRFALAPGEQLAVCTLPQA
jgi:hypothetical protein